MDDVGPGATHMPRRPCPRCGYDLRGIGSAACPECGQPIEPRPQEVSAIAEMAANITSAMQGEAQAPHTVSTYRPKTVPAHDHLNPAVVWWLFGVVVLCLMALLLMLVEQWSDDHGWMLGLTLAPAGLAAALYVARK